MAPVAPTSATAGATSGDGVVPTDIGDRYLAHRPPLGDVTVVDVAGESSDRKLLATTLQGIVNRTEARIYLRGMRATAEDQYWIDWYQSQGLITVTATVGLDAALTTFASEAAGYVVADDAEPWTLNTATTVAGALGGVVVTPATLAAAQGAGLAELDDHRGRWPDAATAYEATAAAWADRLDLASAALQQPGLHNPRDLYVQQGVLVVYTRPSQSDFDRVYDVLETLPTDHPLYGYVSDTGDEEVAAVARIALGGRYLVPTDTTDNLSFHLAVGDAARAVPTYPSVDDVEPCSADDVNVVLAVTDGDNQVIPEAYFPRSVAWNSARRGELPFAWGLNPATSILMPSVWDHYTATAGPNDEIVDLMGLGYTFPSVMPGGTEFLADANRLRDALGIPTHWSLDALIRTPDAGGWTVWDDAIAASGAPGPEGFLLNYVDFGGPAWFHTPSGRVALASQEAQYAAGPAEVLTEIEALQAADPAERPLVNLFAVTVW
ncbi:MAG: hypothetical protein KDA98_01875, partial [Acidimicrobiales bacterium]|nr:hypothetical protein [Acidimicrobiales bacterium]